MNNLGKTLHPFAHQHGVESGEFAGYKLTLAFPWSGMMTLGLDGVIMNDSWTDYPISVIHWALQSLIGRLIVVGLVIVVKLSPTCRLIDEAPMVDVSGAVDGDGGLELFRREACYEPHPALCGALSKERRSQVRH